MVKNDVMPVSASPSEPFATFVPSESEPWGVSRVGHLYRRAGLGASFDELQRGLKLTPQQAVDQLLDYDPDTDRMDELQEQLVGYLKFDEPRQLQNWWLFRLLNTDRPLQERIALVWHNHFATSASKVTQLQLMADQIALFRRMGSGSFRDLLLAVSRDPAMLRWLDGATNRKGAANENWSRELLELFTLGAGHFTEYDVKEVARAFTGWRVENSRVWFDAGGFDDGDKTIFGTTAKWESESAIDLILRQPSAAKHIARRLLREFVHPGPTDEMIDHYAQRLLEHQWQIKPLLREIFASRMFFSDWAYRSRIKSPVDVTVAASRQIGGKITANFVREQTTKMGQSLFFPPNVKGWDGHEAWINANTILLRYNFGVAISTQRGEAFARQVDLEQWLLKHDMRSGEQIVDHFLTLMLDGSAPAELRTALLTYINRGPKGEARPFVLEKDGFNFKLRAIIHLICATPEYQLS